MIKIGTQKAGNSIVNIGSDIEVSYPEDKRTIWKYPLELKDEQILQLPSRSKILTVQIQNGKLQLWALVNPELPKKQKYIYIYGTGHKISNANQLEYISTIQIKDGSLIFHIFEGMKNLHEEM
jgi:hypothetical protein